MADITTNTLKIGDNNLILRDADAQTRITTLEADTSTLKEDKADIDGYYEDMTVGDAEQLVSTVTNADDTPYNFRTTAGSADVGDRAYVDAIVGGTVALNQLVDSASIPATKTESGVTFTNNGDGTITVNGTATADIVYAVNPQKTWSDHKYMISGCPKGGSTSTYNLAMRGMGADRFDTGNGNIWDATGNTWKGVVINIKSGATVTNLVFKPNIFDLTQMFGSTIADYIYSLEQATAGAGVAWFRKLFPKDYYEYNAGELLSVSGLASHDTVGFNQWDEKWELGIFNNTTGEEVVSSNNIRSKNYIPVLPNTTYFAHVGKTSWITILFYDTDKNYISYVSTFETASLGNFGVFTTPSSAAYMRFRTESGVYGTTYLNDICINLSWSGWRNGEYEAYQKHSYPLDDSLTLRGIPKLDAQNNLYYDGDEYLPDGTVNRRCGVVDLGTLTWSHTSAGYFYTTALNNLIKKGSNAGGYNHIKCALYIATNVASLNSLPDKSMSVNSGGNIQIHDSAYPTNVEFQSAMSGVMLLYELATPTIETAEQYQHVQICDDFGTEEYVSTSIVPVGHNTRYPANLRDKLQHLPDLADDDGYYMIGQTNKQMHLERFRIPKAPTSPDGTYVLKATVSGGMPTYTWEAQT